MLIKIKSVWKECSETQLPATYGNNESSRMTKSLIVGVAVVNYIKVWSWGSLWLTISKFDRGVAVVNYIKVWSWGSLWLTISIIKTLTNNCYQVSRRAAEQFASGVACWVLKVTVGFGVEEERSDGLPTSMHKRWNATCPELEQVQRY